jgi:hypothetical protein
MRINAGPFKKQTLLSIAGYIFIITVAAKLIFIYGSRHPMKEDLLPVEGIVTQVRLGGQGRSTWFRIESEYGTQRYSSYYGKLWPGMARIRPGDRVQVLAERDRLKKNDLFTGKTYYIWEMIHSDQVVVAYDDVRRLVLEREAAINPYANGFLAAAAVFLVVAFARRILMDRGKT